MLHAHNVSGPMSAFAVRSARRAGLRTFAKVVNIGPQFDLRVLDNYFLWGRIARRWLRSEYVTRWQAISAAVADDLRRAGIRDDRISMLPNGVFLGDGPEASFHRWRHVSSTSGASPIRRLAMFQDSSRSSQR